MEPMSCKTSPVLRLLLNPLLDEKDILGSRWITSSLRTLSVRSFDGQPIDIPGLLGEVETELELNPAGFQSGILDCETARAG